MHEPASAQPPRRASFATRALAWVVVHLRFLVVAGWIAGAVAAVLFLPGLESAPSPGLRALLPDDAEPLQASRVAGRLFAVPATTGVVVVHRNPHGLRPPAELHAAARARAISRRDRRVSAAVPVTDALATGHLPATTVLYYVFPPAGATPGEAVAAGHAFAARLPHPAGTSTGVTGVVPAELAHSTLARSALLWVQIATIAWVLIAVGVHFRSVIAPLVDLLAVAVAYVLAVHVVGWLSGRMGQEVPVEVKPVMVVLLFGIVTDYTIFLLTRQRVRLAAGLDGRAAAGAATRDVAGIVFAAGITVCAASAVLAAARMDFFALFGPALAISVLIAVLVAVTLVPATLAILGRVAFWPRGPVVDPAQRPQGAEAAALGRPDAPLRGRIVRLAGHHPFVTALVMVAALLAGAVGLRDYRLAVPEIRALPAGAQPQRAYTTATQAFRSQGIVAPTPVIVRAPGIADRRAALARLQRSLSRAPGVAHVLGPAQQPLARSYGVARSKTGDAARFLIAFDDAPMGAQAIATLDRLQHDAPGLARAAGLTRARFLWGGTTAVARAIVQRSQSDIALVGPLALVAIFIVVAIFLRALVAPLYLIFASALSVAAALGITGWVHTMLVGTPGIGFFVPFATAILLLALGSDYTVFLIGRIWQEAPDRPLREAIVAAGTQASRPITVAGVILAGSFAMLAIVPIASYRLAAFTMAVGLLIDALLVRTLLVPALVSMFGRRRAAAPEPAVSEQG